MLQVSNDASPKKFSSKKRRTKKPWDNILRQRSAEEVYTRINPCDCTNPNCDQVIKKDALCIVRRNPNKTVHDIFCSFDCKNTVEHAECCSAGLHEESDKDN